MERIMKKIMNSTRLNHYCANVLKMYNYGRVNCPV